METNNMNDFTQRYIYDVIRRLPESQRADIERELKTLIEDMLAERSGDAEPTQDDIAAVLTELGRPSDLADKYRGEKRYLISGEFYEKYLLVLKIVLPCLAFGTAIAGGISFFTGTNGQTFLGSDIASGVTMTKNLFASIFANVGSTLLSSFAGLTIAFAIIERRFKYHEHKRSAWNVSDLPPIPSRRATIKIHQVVFDIAFTILFMALFAAFPQIFSVWTNTGADGFKVIPIFNLSVWSQIILFFIGWSVLRIVRDCVKLIVGKYDFKVVITSVVIDICCIVLVIAFTGRLDIWNPAFIDQLQRISADGTVVTAQLLNGVLLAIAVISTFVDGLAALVRTLKYTDRI